MQAMVSNVFALSPESHLRVPGTHVHDEVKREHGFCGFYDNFGIRGFTRHKALYRSPRVPAQGLTGLALSPVAVKRLHAVAHSLVTIIVYLRRGGGLGLLGLLGVLGVLVRCGKEQPPDA